MSRINPVLMFDLDGTLIDTDINTPGSAKYLETLEILGEMLGRKDMADFNDFYAAFNKRVVGVTVVEGSMTLCRMIEETYGKRMRPEEFIEYRIMKRGETFRKRVKFIGDETDNNGLWLAQLPEEIKGNAYLVTSASAVLVPLLNENPQLVVDGKGLVDFFEGRIITADDVNRKKPFPDCYNLAIERSNAESGIAFEDSIHGIHAARNANYGGLSLIVVGIESSRTKEELISAGAHNTAKALHYVNLEEIMLTAIAN